MRYLFRDTKYPTFFAIQAAEQMLQHLRSEWVNEVGLSWAWAMKPRQDNFARAAKELDKQRERVTVGYVLQTLHVHSG